MRGIILRTTSILAVTVSSFFGSAAFAQDNEIIVTARKKEETLQDVPVVITAFNAKMIADLNLRSVEDIASQTPQLMIQAKTSSGQGQMSLRGVTTGGNSYGADQAIAINVDGVQISHTLGLRIGQHDLQQVEILKGPQALFFGKNSPGGVVSMRTADPTKEFYTQVRTGYEFNAKEKYGEVIVAGPASDSLGYRAVFYASDMDGAFRNVGNPALIGPLADRTGPDERELFGRLTLAFDPSATFNAKLKLSYTDIEGGQLAAGTQNFNCAPPGNPLVQPSDNCKLDEEFVLSDPVSTVAGASPLFRDGKPYQDTTGFLGSLEMNWNPTDTVKVTSVTGYSDIRQTFYSTLTTGTENNFPPPATAPVDHFSFALDTRNQAFSQELRLASDFKGPVNFVVGGYVDDVLFNYAAAYNFFATVPTATARQKTNTLSAFGQASIKLGNTVTLTGGLRYTHEKKNITGTGSASTNPPLLLTPDKVTFNNMSAEATLSWEPTDDVTLYAAYREGYKSGGFNIIITQLNTAITTPQDISYRQETVRGGEIGIKTSLLDDQLQFNAAAYYFKYKDLQLSVPESPTSVNINTKNAGGMTTKGFEIETRWKPGTIEGLSINASAAYNHSRFSDFNSPCYVGQTFADGCNLDLNTATAGFDSQSLAGKPIERAPGWVGSVGLAYDTPLNASGLGLRFVSRATYSDAYFTDSRLDPRSIQSSFWKIDASLALYNSERGYEFALIGRNLTNKITAIRGNADPVTRNIYGTPGTPRQIYLQLTLRPGELFR
jgi:iron complex outermembrane receptor protein